ncbi:MAG: hypothetical protein JW951_01825 [Lentisphaerae bacterium]|nr:hypothetical protein [Lentisphaerota bacterium]
MKVWKTTMTVLAMAGILAGGSATARAELISLFTFDDDSTIQTNAVAGAYNGSLVNGPTNVAGVCGQALDFVAASSQYMDMDQDTTHVTRPNTTDGAGGLYGGSVSFWIKTDQLAQAKIFSARSPANYFGFLLNSDAPDKIRFYLRENGAEALRAYMGADNTWRNGSWHHILCSWTNTTGVADTGVVAFYLDGEAKAVTYAENDHTSATTLGAWNSAAGERMKIGAFRDGTQTFLILKAVYAGGPGTSDQTGDGATWVYTSGLPPLSNVVGTVINDGGAIVMDASGNGVRKVGGALLSLLRFDGDADNAVAGAPGGSISNGAGFVTGKIGQALNFDGVNQYVDMVNGARPNSVDGGIWSGSIGMWIRSTSAESDCIFSVMSGNTSYMSIELNQANNLFDGTCRFYLRMQEPGAATELKSWLNADLGVWRGGEWHHVLWAWHATEGAAGTGGIALYIDGVIRTIATPDNTHTADRIIDNWSAIADRRMKIGTRRQADWSFYTGDMDDLASWGVELTAIEAKALYELGNELGYDAVDSQVVLDVFAQGPGGIGYTSDTRAWEYRGGLPGTPGELNGLTLVLDAGGNGVAGLPQGTIILLR